LKSGNPLVKPNSAQIVAAKDAFTELLAIRKDTPVVPAAHRAGRHPALAFS
jgi:hypothetical protein